MIFSDIQSHKHTHIPKQAQTKTTNQRCPRGSLARPSCTHLRASTLNEEGLKGVPSVLGIKPSPLPLERGREKDKMISIYQRSVPAHPIERLGRADPTICIAGCSKRKENERGRREGGYTFLRGERWNWEVVRKERRATLDRSKDLDLLRGKASCLGKQYRALRLLHAITSSMSFLNHRNIRGR